MEKNKIQRQAASLQKLKQMEDSLAKDSSLLRILVDNLPHQIFVKDTNSAFVFTNPSCAKLVNAKTPEAMTGKTDFDYLSRERAEKNYAEEQKILQTGKPVISREGYKFSSGQKRYFLVTKVPWRDNSGNIIGIIGINHEITKIKQIEEELQKARHELKSRVEQRTTELKKTNRELRNEIAERKKAQDKLLIYQEQLRSLASELSLSEERIRRQMATNVHDRVGQTLAISKIKLESMRESVSSQELAKSLEEISRLISQAIESTRSLTFELSPPVLYELGFEAAVEWLVRHTEEQHGLAARFKDDGKYKPLDDNVRILLFQGVRELLVNAAKHSKAKRVTVSIRRVKNEIQVSIEDDGIGFDASRVHLRKYTKGGYGLFNIRERLKHIGGHVEIDSKTGHGTRVTLSVPTGHQKNKTGGTKK
jgi:PAS domain S-box-containing protein